MKKTVSALLSVLLLLLCFPLGIFADGAEDGTPLVNSAALGSAIGSSSDATENAKATDGDTATFFQATADGDYVGFDLSKEKNVKLSQVYVYVSTPSAGDEATYTVSYFRNNRWYELFTFEASDCVPSGTESVSKYSKELDEALITQQIKVTVTGTEGSSAMPRIYDISAYGQMLENVAIKGKAYASSFKHFDWTPPASANDGRDFDDDWHGWEPQYPTVVQGANTSNGFSGDYWGVEFINKEYYEISELVFYMSVHNSYAEPAMGYQDTKYKVEALCEGEWIVIAEFSDSDSLPRSYDTYEEAMANDTGAHHIASYYTAVLETPVTTNNIRVTISEFAKNYQGVERLVFPYIYELRAFGVRGETPDIELPEGARYSTDATSNGIPYASSSASDKYPLLAIDDTNNTGWAPSDKTAGQTYGVYLDKVYTVNDIHLIFADASFSAPFKVEALVDGEWVKVLDGNVSDAFVESPDGMAVQEKIYPIDDVTTKELRVVFTSALTDVPEIREISANMISSLVSFVEDNPKVEAVKDSANKFTGINLNEPATVTGVGFVFTTSVNNKVYIQVNVEGIWQTVHTLESVEAGECKIEVYSATDSIRITYSNSSNAPGIGSAYVITAEDSGDIGCTMKYTFDFIDGDDVRVDMDFGKEYTADRLDVSFDAGTEAKYYNGEGEYAIGDGELGESTPVKGVTAYASGSAAPAIGSVKANIVGVKTFFIPERYTTQQKSSASRGNLAILGAAYANSNYPAMSYASFINDGRAYGNSPAWVPMLEEYSTGRSIYCGIKFHKEYTVDRISVLAADVGNLDGIGNSFEIQARVDGEYVKIGEGNTCAEGREYRTVYKIAPVTTDDIRLVFKNSSIYIPSVIELEIYSGENKPSPFNGYPVGLKIPEVTVFKSETPRFEVAGLPK